MANQSSDSESGQDRVESKAVQGDLAKGASDPADLARTLVAYQDEHKLDTITKVVRHWAEQRGEEAERCVNEVTRAMGAYPLQVVNLKYPSRLISLVQAILEKDGNLVSEEEIDSSVHLVLSEISAGQVLEAKSSTAYRCTSFYMNREILAMSYGSWIPATSFTLQSVGQDFFRYICDRQNDSVAY